MGVDQRIAKVQAGIDEAYRQAYAGPGDGPPVGRDAAGRLSEAEQYGRRAATFAPDGLKAGSRSRNPRPRAWARSRPPRRRRRRPATARRHAAHRLDQIKDGLANLDRVSGELDRLLDDAERGRRSPRRGRGSAPPSTGSCRRPT